MKSNLIKVSIGAIAMAAMIGLSGTASAQRYDRDRDNQRPVHGQRSWNIRAMVDDAERDSNAMRHQFELQLDRMPNYERRRVAGLKSAIQTLDESFEALRRFADDRRPRAGQREMNSVLADAQRVSELMERRPQAREMVGGEWGHLRADINRLANAYGMTPIGR